MTPSLKASHRDAFNEGSQHMFFFLRNKKIICGLSSRLAVITVLGNTANFDRAGNTGKYKILELFELKYSALFP